VSRKARVRYVPKRTINLRARRLSVLFVNSKYVGNVVNVSCVIRRRPNA
jgi:hypothetical protein